MQAICNLREDHKVILEAMTLLDHFCALFESGTVVDPVHLETMLLFIRSYVDDYHHRKEETILFPILMKKGIPKEHGPIGCMLHEHESGRKFIQRMAQTIVDLKSGNKEAACSFVFYSRKYLLLLTHHIYKENQMLFQMADQVLSLEEQEQMANHFNHLSENRPQILLEKLEVLKGLYNMLLSSA